MLPLRYAPQWRIASALLLLAVLVATLAPAVWFWSDKVKLASWISHVDKWAHVTTFVVLTVWFCGIYRRRSYWLIAVGLTVFGLLIEIFQRVVGYRSAEVIDLIADIIGILIGLGIALSGAGGWSLRIESWLEKRQS